jgi:putative flippase GtrA
MKIVGFGIVSVIGLALDFGVFTSVVLLGGPPFLSNLVSACCGVVFVFFVALHAVFEDDGRYVWGKLAIYLTYQVLSISLFSAAIAWVSASSGIFPPFAKLMTTPFSFYTNFLFMGSLTERRLRLY